MSSINEEKWQEVVASFSNSFSVLDGGSTGIDDGVLMRSAVSVISLPATFTLCVRMPLFHLLELPTRACHTQLSVC